MRWRWFGYGLAALGSLLVIWPAYRAVGAWRFRDSLDRAHREIASGRFDRARERLAWLAASWPGQAEVEYQLGICEQAQGDVGAAVRAWNRVPSGSPLAARAVERRDRMLKRILDRGQFTILEEALNSSRREPGPAAVESAATLARLWRMEGRFDEVRGLLQDNWDREPDPAGALRELWLLETEPISVAGIRRDLEQAGRHAPDDDRVWLGKANLAIWSGQFAEAAAWLDACLRRRPHDSAAWRARLKWAMDSERVVEAEQALRNLPAGRFSSDEALALRAWFAAHRGDPQAEWLALENVINHIPGDSRALERLAALAFEAGQYQRAAELRRRKAEIDRDRERYRALLAHGAPTGAQAELAPLAEALGRWFEAWGWWTLIARREPQNRVALEALRRLTPRIVSPRPSSDQTLAHQFADLVSFPRPTRPDPAARRSGAPPEFDDDAEEAGLRFVHESGRSPLHQLPETMGGGVGLLDFDDDGWLDVYCVQGGPFPPPAVPPPSAGDRLFRNRGDGRFEIVTRAAGLGGGYGHGVAVGDYDNDGRPDLFVTRWRSYALYHNRGDGRFEDVTAAAGLGGDRDWPTSAAWADLDDDGDLDLFVCHYLAWDADHPLRCPRFPKSDRYAYCDPRRCAPLPDHFFRNDGGRFVDISAQAGMVDRQGRGLGVVAADIDGDHRIDVFVANDTTANDLWRNRGGGRFEEIGASAGVAANADGHFLAGMGVACGDVDGDGLPDLVVTNFYGESTTYYRNLGGGAFVDQSSVVGLAAPSRPLLGFGIALFDYNNDGWLDLATANGHVNDGRPNVPYEMPAQLLAGGKGGRFIDVSSSRKAPWGVLRIGRGLAAGDLDNDGRIDFLLVSQDQPMAYFHNRTAGGHFVTFRLEGTASNRDAVGACVTITSGGHRQVAQRIGGGSYLSAADARLHFGLNGAVRVETVEVVWPSGHVDRHDDLPANTGYLLREGQAKPEPLDGFSRPRQTHTN